MSNIDLLKAVFPTVDVPPNETWSLDHMVGLLRQHPDWSCVDIGAGNGTPYAVAMRHFAPLGRHLAIEPGPDNFAKLRVVAEPEVICRRVALASAPRPSTRMFHWQYWTLLPEGDARQKDARGAVFDAEFTTLDAACAEAGVVPDLLKIDVDGYELEVLGGAHAVLQRRPVIVIEMCDYTLKHFGRGIEELVRLLRNTWSYKLLFEPDGAVHDEAAAVARVLQATSINAVCVP